MTLHQINVFRFTFFNFYAIIYQMSHQKMEGPLLAL